MKRPTWAVLISGRGSNLAALLELRDEIDIRLVISSRANAPGLLRARRAGIPTLLTPFIQGTKKIDWDFLYTELKSALVTHVFLAGFMKIVPPAFIARFPAGSIVNLHPSLLPAYPGLNSIERAHSEGTELGATVHEVVAEVDAGKIICQRHTLSGQALAACPFPEAEFLVHVDEQRIIKETLRKWRSISAG